MVHLFSDINPNGDGSPAQWIFDDIWVNPMAKGSFMHLLPCHILYCSPPKKSCFGSPRSAMGNAGETWMAMAQHIPKSVLKVGRFHSNGHVFSGFPISGCWSAR